ncbi:hypothetical protein [Vibrio harveyi]|uniref:hypothetical protein n=1 Tax=Vibrio harveyi TaxID=669 RepID=UPI003CF51B20
MMFQDYAKQRHQLLCEWDEQKKLTIAQIEEFLELENGNILNDETVRSFFEYVSWRSITKLEMINYICEVFKVTTFEWRVIPASEMIRAINLVATRL